MSLTEPLREVSPSHRKKKQSSGEEEAGKEQASLRMAVINPTVWTGLKVSI